MYMNLKELCNSKDNEAVKIAKGYKLLGIRSKDTRTIINEIKEITIIRSVLLL